MCEVIEQGDGSLCEVIEQGDTGFWQQTIHLLENSRSIFGGLS